jgi:two-component system response regulator HydG
VDVRIISTTNKDLLQEVERGRFRQDLYYRLSTIRLFVWPLRDRKEDLPDLVWHFVNMYAREARRRISKLDPVMMDILARYRWPGNVRQLRNVVRTSLILGAGETLSLADVSWLLDRISPCTHSAGGQPCQPQRHQDSANSSNTQLPGSNQATADSGWGGLPLELVERRAILDTLHQTAGNQARAAKVLGISDRTLRDKIRRYRQEGCLQVT